MDFLLGITGSDFTMVLADKMVARSILVMKSDQDKMLPLNDHTLLLSAGDNGDCTYFGEYIQKNIQLYQMRNSIELGTEAAAHYTRGALAGYLRSKTPYQVNLLIAGYDKTDGPKLFWMDYLASMQELPYAAHGYGSNFCLGLLDRQFKKDMTKEECRELIMKCLEELSTRFLIKLSSFVLRVVDKDGIHLEEFDLKKAN